MPVVGGVIELGVQYFGTIVGKTLATLGMIVASSHTAVWLGASTPNARTWVQAGLEGGVPYAYIETGRRGGEVTLREWRVPSGHVAVVHLRHRGNWWRVLIDDRHSRWMRVRNAKAITTLETDGPAVALIDGRIVSGG